ncbi:MAG: hypothetical protein LBL72_02215 [Candidatus Accumulibacter sp.]|jgi:hypothetical protein|nr:hypothetical protein [Accumulibacter sp.]
MDILLLSAGAAWVLVLLLQGAAGKLYRKKFGKSLSSNPVREALVGLVCIGLLCLVSVSEIGLAFLWFALFSVFAAIVVGLFHLVGLGTSAAWRIVLASIGGIFLAIHVFPQDGDFFCTHPASPRDARYAVHRGLYRAEPMDRRPMARKQGCGEGEGFRRGTEDIS